MSELDAPPIAPTYLRIRGALRSHTWPSGPTVSDYVCPHAGCRVGRIYTGPLLRATTPGVQVWANPCDEHAPAVTASLARLGGPVWQQTKPAHKGWGWRPAPKPGQAAPAEWAPETVFTEDHEPETGARLIVYGPHPHTGQFWTKPDHPFWPAIVALHGGQLDLLSEAP
jgi:hypothetical protein